MGAPGWLYRSLKGGGGIGGAGSSMAIGGGKGGATGPFAFNVGVKQGSRAGAMFQYVISTRSRDLGNVTDDNIFYPNQVLKR